MSEFGTSFQGIAPLPPKVISIGYGVFKLPTQTGEPYVITVPTNYRLYVGEVAPTGDIGSGGDWYIWNQASSIRVYRKVISSWVIITTITGGGGGTSFDNVAITNSTFTTGTITGAVIIASTITAPVISAPVVTGGSFTGITVTGSTMIGPVINNPIITGVANPVLASDAANKAYVDGIAAGVQIHAGCVAATVGNVNIAGGAPSTVDSITLALNDRVLVKSQSDPKQNGIYYVSNLGTGSNGTWTRATDADADGELDQAYTLVNGGSVNGGSSYVCTSPTPVIIGTSDVLFTQYFAISSVPANKITGLIIATQIGSVDVGTLTGFISAGQIGTVNASAIIGAITASQISSVNASAIAGSITASQISSVAAPSITGSIVASQIGSVSATNITGVIVGAQLTDQILNTQRLIANDISIVKRVTSLPSLPSADYPTGSLVLRTTNQTLYQNIANVWSVVTASSSVVGTLTSNDIASVSASTIIGLIIASQIGSVNVSALVGSISASQISSVSASSITGTITSSQISSVNSTSIIGTISAAQIGSVNASTITIGLITDGQIGSVNAGKITTGTLAASISLSAGVFIKAGSGVNQVVLGTNSAGADGITVGGGTNSLGDRVQIDSAQSQHGISCFNNSNNITAAITTATSNGGEIFLGTTAGINSAMTVNLVGASGKMSLSSTSSTASSILYGPNAGAVQGSYALSVIHRSNSTSNYGLFVGTNWLSSENKIFTAAGVDATSGAVFERFNVRGDGIIEFGTYTGTPITCTGYITIRDIAGNTRRLMVG